MKDSDLLPPLFLALGMSLSMNVLTVWGFSTCKCQLVNPLLDVSPVDLGDALMEPGMPTLIYPTPKAVPIPLLTNGTKN